MAKQKGSSTKWFYAPPPSSMPGGIPLESLAGIAWNPWLESNGICSPTLFVVSRSGVVDLCLFIRDGQHHNSEKSMALGEMM